MSMQIACPRGGTQGHPHAHGLTEGQVERVVYALTGAYADAVVEGDGVFEGESSHDHLPCPLEVLDWARDAEMYREYVDSFREQARAARRLAS